MAERKGSVDNHDLVILQTANEIVAASGLQAEFLGDAMAVGVVGDHRAFTRVINLSGPFPGWDHLAQLSTQISNTLPIVRVTYEPVVVKLKSQG